MMTGFESFNVQLYKKVALHSNSQTCGVVEMTSSESIDVFIKHGQPRGPHKVLLMRSCPGGAAAP